jgi:hypothetical protein
MNLIIIIKEMQANIDEEERIMMMAEVDRVIDDIWDHYDKDGSGFLDQHEARRFLKDIIRQSGLSMKGADEDV